MKQDPFAGKKLMTPGPVPMSEAVKKSLSAFECHHRSAEFEEILQRVLSQLPKVFVTEQPAYALAATGTGGLEAAIVNTMTRDRKALFLNAGKFGERWGKIAKKMGVPFDEILVPWGQDINLAEVEDCLQKEDYQALAWQASETSTGALLPSRELAELGKKYDALTVVDAITALGAVPLPMDEWGLDVVVGGSQKALMLPTGMAFLALSEKAQKRNSDIPHYYFDLQAERQANLKGRTRYSTPTQFIIALDIVLQEVLKPSLQAYHQVIAERARVFREAAPLPVFPQTPSPSLSCLQVPEGVSAVALKEQVAAKGYLIVAGQDQLKDRVIRIGHMGDMSHEDLQQTARAIETCL
jgi:aspartate aminotransferase-like enzyme